MLVCVIHEMNRLLDGHLADNTPVSRLWSASGSIGTALEVELHESPPPD